VVLGVDFEDVRGRAVKNTEDHLRRVLVNGEYFDARKVLTNLLE
jgi:hypothetical protein